MAHFIDDRQPLRAQAEPVCELPQLRPAVDELLAAHLCYLRSANAAPRSQVDRVKTVRQCLRQLDADPLTVTTEQLTEWLANGDWAKWTRHTYRNHVRGFFNWLHEFGHRIDDPAARLPPARAGQGVPKPVTDNELDDALARSTGMWRTVILLVAYAGLRASEAAALCREDVTESLITVRSGKGDKSAQLPTAPEIWAHVRDLPPGPVVRTVTGQPISGRRLSTRARGYFDGLGMPRVHLHRFRHWFGTTVQRNQGDIRVTQELMRHSSVASTQIYTLVATAAKVAAIAGLSGRS